MGIARSSILAAGLLAYGSPALAQQPPEPPAPPLAPSEYPQPEVSPPGQAQPAQQPAQPEPEKPASKFEIYGFAMFDGGYDFGQIGDPNWQDTLRPTKLPAFRDQFGKGD